MNGLHAADLLRLLELGHGRGPLDRGLLLLAHAWPSADRATLSALPLAARDRRLIDLRRATFGRVMTVTATCPACGAQLETPLDLDHLRAQPAATPDADGVYAHDGLRFRLPSTDDLRAALGSPDPRATLVARTVIDPAGVDADALAAAWDAVEPLADIRLAFDCVECGHAFDRVFDPVEALTAEVEAHARRLLLDIHALASAYGWTEAEVLGLGAVRRRLYVQMVAG